MSPESLPPIDQGNTKNSRYQCPKCKIGNMVNAELEGEPEYTDIYTCNNCQHRDNICSRAIVNSQTLTGILGLFFCSFLMVTSLMKMQSAMAMEGTSELWRQTSFATLALLFLCGFIYVVIQAHKARIKRRLYHPS